LLTARDVTRCLPIGIVVAFGHARGLHVCRIRAEDTQETEMPVATMYSEREK